MNTRSSDAHALQIPSRKTVASCPPLPPPPPPHSSIIWVVSNWRSGRCRLTWGYKLKSDGAESGELGGSCSNSKPKYLQMSCLSFVDTLLLLELLFCPFLEFHTPLTAILGLTCSEKRRQMSEMLSIVLQEVIVCKLYPFLHYK